MKDPRFKFIFETVTKLKERIDLCDHQITVNSNARD